MKGALFLSLPCCYLTFLIGNLLINFIDDTETEDGNYERDKQI